MYLTFTFLKICYSDTIIPNIFLHFWIILLQNAHNFDLLKTLHFLLMVLTSRANDSFIVLTSRNYVTTVHVSDDDARLCDGPGMLTCIRNTASRVLTTCELPC